MWPVVGESGMAIRLLTNVFGVDVANEFHIYQYSVDFLPDVPSPPMRKAMILTHRDLFGPVHLFDRNTLFTAVRLERDVSFDQRVTFC
jgi:hypothetical protein